MFNKFASLNLKQKYMNRLYTLFLLSALMFSIKTVNAQNPIPNSSFEAWNPQGNYSDPESWDTPNAALSFLNVITVSESDDAYEGTKSIKLETGSLFGAMIPGTATLGEINVDIMNMDASIDGGVPYDERPLRLRGFYKYAPQTGDTCAIIALFYKYNAETGIRDTVGVGSFLSSGSTSEWTEFSANIDWYNAENPDTTNIIMLSSASMTISSGGSQLLIDDLSYEFTVGISDAVLSSTEVEIFPVPAKKYVNVNLNENPQPNTVFELYNLTGMRVLTSHLTDKNNQIILNMLPEGIYFFSITESNRLIKNGKLVISE
ncbi:MAG: hypothetical protein C0593_13385 [Marinilabiliales bacterium]|nr:MAG: hypothetical protein C0593_13385 [Marinilabiliales bacterium]